MPDHAPRSTSPLPGEVRMPEPGVRQVLANNPSPMTCRGTNTFIVGTGDVAVIDPGPADPAHLAAILAALRPGEKISHIIVTHAHLDHSPLAAALSAATDAPVLAFGDAASGRSARMSAYKGLKGGEGLDRAFRPDVLLQDGDILDGPDWSLHIVHTPGHLGGHICLAKGDLLFSGDHVMEWAPSLVSPPDGDMTDYLASLERLMTRPWRRFLPAHGDPVEEPATRLSALLSHRRGREAAILDALCQPATPGALTDQVYKDIAPALRAAAQRNLLAHLIDLLHRNEVFAESSDITTAIFHRR